MIATGDGDAVETTSDVVEVDAGDEGAVGSVTAHTVEDLGTGECRPGLEDTGDVGGDLDEIPGPKPTVALYNSPARRPMAMPWVRARMFSMSTAW